MLVSSIKCEKNALGAFKRSGVLNCIRASRKLARRARGTIGCNEDTWPSHQTELLGVQNTTNKPTKAPTLTDACAVLQEFLQAYSDSEKENGAPFVDGPSSKPPPPEGVLRCGSNSDNGSQDKEGALPIIEMREKIQRRWIAPLRLPGAGVRRKVWPPLHAGKGSSSSSSF